LGSGSEPGGAARAAFADDVRRGLTSSPRRLPCRWLYDREGSLLFEAICELPEYYIPSAERAILTAHAAEIAAELPPGAQVVELGSGNAAKTRILLEAFLARAAGRVRYAPIDISPSALVASAHELLADYPRLDITGIAGTYEEGLAHLPGLGGAPRLVLWLGSNVGNFTRAEAGAFLGEVRKRLGPDDRLLLGVDLRKDPSVLIAAYDDPAGVTSRFNLNLLARINRELGGRFDLSAFRHRALYEKVAGRMVMHLVAQRACEVPIADLGMSFSFAAGEGIHTEDSYKYDREEIDALARAAGLTALRLWTDSENRFASVLLAAAPPKASSSAPPA
jgi:dimethylhistidine N-methyltransferase